jgi:hypothetical protein
MGDWKYRDSEEVQRMSAGERAQYQREQEVAVFGVNAQRGPDGQMVEQGKGSKSQQTAQHREALEKENWRKEKERRNG